MALEHADNVGFKGSKFRGALRGFAGAEVLLGEPGGDGARIEGEFAGEMNLSSIQRGPFQNAYVGYWIDEAKAGHGYTPEALVGRHVAAVVNFPPRQIGKFMSEVLTLGFPAADGSVVLVVPDKSVPNGGKLF